jgi:hypothetical protein
MEFTLQLRSTAVVYLMDKVVVTRQQHPLWPTSCLGVPTHTFPQLLEID